MFDRDIIDDDGEIPKVFRAKVLMQDTQSSLSKLMSDIDGGNENEENIPDEEQDEMIENELHHLERDSGNTSVNSMM